MALERFTAEEVVAERAVMGVFRVAEHLIGLGGLGHGREFFWGSLERTSHRALDTNHAYREVFHACGHCSRTPRLSRTGISTSSNRRK